MAGVKLVFSAVVVLYPIIVYFSLDFLEPRLIALGLVVIALVRLYLVGRRDFFTSRKLQPCLVVAALLLAGVSAMASNSAVLLQYYPVYVSAFMLALFVYSLIRPPSIVEQIARPLEGGFTQAAVTYTRRVTMVWCGFFVFNGAMSLYTILAADMDIWAIYNGFISYCLIGLLFGGEVIVRRMVKRAAAPSAGGKSWVE